LSARKTTSETAKRPPGRRVARNAAHDFYRTRKPTQELDEPPTLRAKWRRGCRSP
jgi:hypothetical protein